MVMSLILKHFAPASTIAVTILLWRFFTYHINLIVGGIVFFRVCRKFLFHALDTPSAPCVEARRYSQPNLRLIKKRRTEWTA